ncbi:FYVE zinc finger-domain-containing protein [Blyttiomyces helicus]|uniref:FYVE zinc finger-domain-containing protein n=1 Tax=Blyttiomyces helicus TaxID=388810 RepID=A0A4P9WIG8_9FUNG|nr:FYVE zinc finger-domain-containing protein [Blyttiomyces helicus]|eukprot:RKO90920.1 FYVE zinc finger-domain-containing protein [Blyttiomyces helicus]
MVSLAQLNRHIDDLHSEDDTKEAILSWLRRTQRRVAAPFTRAAQKTSETLTSLTLDRITQPIAAGVGVVPPTFELNPNGTPTGGIREELTREMGGAGESDPGVETPINRGHWQREGANDVCASAGCGKSLGMRNGKHNCRRCGRLYCDAHSSYQMRLTTDARHDPVNGHWHRTCGSCFEGRDGYRDTSGVIRNRTRTFLQLRKVHIDRLHLESNKLEKRLDKVNFGAPFLGAIKPLPIRLPTLIYLCILFEFAAIDQTVVTWEDDSSATACPICNKGFRALVNRKHHCRLCGRVICGAEECSSIVPLHASEAADERHPDRVGEIRACRDCNSIVFRRRADRLDKPTTSPVVKAYQAISTCRARVEQVLPKFNEQLMILSSQVEIKLEDSAYLLAQKHRKSLMDYFAELDRLSKQIKALPAKSSDTRRIQENISLSTLQFLQTHMFTLRLMPNAGRRAPAPQTVVISSSPSSPAPPKPKRAAEPPKRPLSPGTQAELDVLEEQRRQVEGFIDEAVRRRKLEDAAMLRESLMELEDEIERRRAGGR